MLFKKMKFLRTDAHSIYSQIKCQEKQIKLKRRWLLGVPLSKSEKKKLNKIFKNWYLPESLIREDDMFYHSVRAHVERNFGVHRVERDAHVPQDDMHLIQMPNVKKLISSCLDNLTTKGLYHLAMIVTGGSFKSELTRCKLKDIIKDSLSSVLGSKNHDHCQLETRKRIFLLLTNPEHFRDMCEPLPALLSQSYHAAVAKILHELPNLPTQTLNAMRRKLKGVKAPIPQLQPRRQGWVRDHLIKLVEKMSKEMLLQLNRENEPPEPLAKAMAVADLSLKLTTGCHNIFSKEFYPFSPEVKSLQSDILNAICFVKKVVASPELKNLQLLIEPKAVIRIRSLRTAFVNFLTEFLYECSDLDRIPKSLLQILDVTSKVSKSRMHDKLFKKKRIEEEVDSVLNLSALTKQILFDLLPDDQFDQDFTDAYMEQLEDSDDSSSDEDGEDSQPQEDLQFRNKSFASVSDYDAESIGDFAPFEFHPSTTMTEENVLSSSLSASDWLNSGSEKLQPNNCNTVNLESKLHSTPRNMTTNQCQGEGTEHLCASMASKNKNSSVVSHDTELDENVVKRHDIHETDTEMDPKETANLFHDKTEPIPTKHSACKNHYLTTQDACDKTSMLAYNIIGRILEEFAIVDKTSMLTYNLSGDNHIEDMEDTEEQSPCGEHGSAFVRVVKELLPSFPDSSMERLKILMRL
ncbi:hypothetical protein RJT34_31982 [Clitoria ternatea]|uniref:Uncharacterized protein n=1 Tax=Clitoria ternatea TaxID=43366 RepID=A0AAN9EV87_CLITE